MGNYGSHPTRYGHLCNDELHSMYRESVYRKLSENEKLDLLQETVNRDALERGELGAPRVEFASLPDNESGCASNGVISINRNMAIYGIQKAEYNGQTIYYHMDDYNIQALNTVLHENVHCFQDQITDGTIHINDPQLTAEYRANSFTVCAVSNNGSYKLGSLYLTGETPGGYYLYYFQATEREAFRLAEIQTDTIIQSITMKYGTEPAFEAYARTISATGYAVREQEAIQLFQNPNFVHDLNQILQNHYFGSNKPVNAATERAVRAEMIETYNKMSIQISPTNTQETREDNKMSFDPNKPVTLAEYNQSLRDSVNAYYTHALNDPHISQEDAIQSTSEMAEKYFEAVEDFQEAQNVHTVLETGNDAEVENHGEPMAITSMIDSPVDNEIGAGCVEADEGNSGTPSTDNNGIEDGEDCDDDLNV